MKFSKLRQLMLVSAIGLLVATLFSGCQLVTIDYLFVSTSASQIGRTPPLVPPARSKPTPSIRSPARFVPALHRSAPAAPRPTALAVSPGTQNLYVANQVDMNIVHFAIASNGVLTRRRTASRCPQRP